MAQGDDIFLIPGTKKIHRLEGNLFAAKFQLNTKEEKEIRQACELVEVAGNRYPESMVKALFADTPPLENCVPRIIMHCVLPLSRIIRSSFNSTN